MLKKRLIPILLLQNGLLVRSELFKLHQIIGNPIHEVERFNEWNVDELVYIDITKDGDYDCRRNDGKIKTINTPLSILEEVSKTCFMPLTWGGRIRTTDDIHQRITRGADKITINTAAYETPNIITQGAKRFGSQAIVVSIDILRKPDNTLEVLVDGGRKSTGLSPDIWAKEVEERGAGEILIQCIHRDGTGSGYDLDAIHCISSKVQIPVIACSGAGSFDDYAACIEAGADAVAAANIWHFKELADKHGKRALSRSGIPVRI